MINNIIIAFDGKSKKAVDNGGVFICISYERLRWLLANDEFVHKDEAITGLIINESGIKIRLDKKK